MGFKTVVLLAAFCALIHSGYAQKGRKGGRDQQESESEALKIRYVKICVPEHLSEVCQQMVQEVSKKSLNFECILGRDKIDCMKKIVEGEADVAPFDPEEIFVAGKYFHDDLVVIKEIRTADRAREEHRYDGVAVIKSNSGIHSLTDLRGKKSCHTGYDRTVGWRVPIPRLMKDGVIHLNCDKSMSFLEQEISSVAKFFGPSCVSREWGDDHEISQRLKKEYHSLCDLCANPVACDANDKYAGYEGTLKCITEGDGDIAWTKLNVVQEFFGLKKMTIGDRSHAKDFSFLCPDGHTEPLTSEEPCTWAGRPWSGFLIKKGQEIDWQMEIKKNIRLARIFASTAPDSHPWMTKILDFAPKDVDYDHPFPQPASTYVSEANYTLTIERPECRSEEYIRWCVVGQEQMEKCREFSQVAHARRIRPEFTCVLGLSRDQCAEMIKNGQADIMVRYSTEVYEDQDNEFHPLASTTVADLSPYRYYSVAVVKVNSGIYRLEDLRGKKSCHSGFRCYAGFLYPAYVLKEKHLIYPFNCDYAMAMAKFFSGMCAPGAMDPENNPQGTNPDNLCSVCVGRDIDLDQGTSGLKYVQNGEAKCSATNDEAFYGYDGAFRCLASGHGDVAFTKHMVVQENTDGHNPALWADDLKSSDYRLLCKEGGLRPVDDFETCNWGKIPGSKIVTSSKKNSAEIEDMRLALLNVGDTFGSEYGQEIFHLFTQYSDKGNFLSDTVANIVPLEPVNINYMKMLQTVRNCHSEHQSLNLINCAKIISSMAQEPARFCAVP